MPGYDDAVQALADQAPPLTEATRARLAGLLQPAVIDATHTAARQAPTRRAA